MLNTFYTRFLRQPVRSGTRHDAMTAIQHLDDHLLADIGLIRAGYRHEDVPAIVAASMFPLEADRMKDPVVARVG